jgi:hypothetical protein
MRVLLDINVLLDALLQRNFSLLDAQQPGERRGVSPT